MALEGRVKPHHRFVLTELLCEIDNLDDTIARFDEQIQEYARPFEEAIQHLDTRRSKKKAIMAVAHSFLVIAYHLIQRHEDYRELGGDYFEKRRPETTAKHLIKRLEGLGYAVTVQAPTAVTAA
jgi:hypothetical protein